MVWFPLDVEDGEVSWRFDIVGLLAVVGGSAIEKHAQAITASHFGSLPRLMPAPETMLNTDRPSRLPAVKDVTVVGVKSGNQFNELNYFANVIHNIESLPAFHFQSFHISHRPLPEKEVKEQEEEQAKEWEKAKEKARKAHDKAVKETKNDVERKAVGEYKDPPKPPLKAIIPLYPDCVLNFITLASICITIALSIWAGVQHDAVALLGLGSMALSTSMACMSAQWRPRLTTRTAAGQVVEGDVVIRTRSGAFVSVRCSEEVARELYAGTETCEYVYNGRYHQALLATSTVLLMAAIIFLSNCGWKIQIAVGLAYIILNLAYWAMALLTDPRGVWNMEHRYEVELLERKDNENFTQVLWDVIRTTGEIRWAKKTGAAPATKNWKGWLKEAKENAHNPNWDCVERRDWWMKQKFEKEHHEDDESWQSICEPAPGVA
ncbi:uncharacterized protein P174DRAFT_443463 [Aspergillus novofumigatus IBT 16806]|uniref:Uncharacterized protein n=1 Tax=Aspergillus novofumigatus (strain IBT 16806) TaxID=1392255 RepID=A0A2I1C1F6_ASPN1|nr:uncharacterized protein P174DRAFT_443463 [Aspergillus novofumigatus IBT 16806]PKX91470.1 hypothetical protein P174DRAFT_443463 [Aspergillus novofumigatus IBT 16806]